MAWFSTRLRDIYFAITTLIFSQIFYVLIFTWTDMTGGENGLTFRRPRLSIPGIAATPFTNETLLWGELQRLPKAVMARDDEVLRFVDQHALFLAWESAMSMPTCSLLCSSRRAARCGRGINGCRLWRNDLA